MTDEEFKVWARKEARRAAYETGRYALVVPPGNHSYWTDADWKRYIDLCDGWYDKSLRDPV